MDMQYHLLVHMLVFILLLWRISMTTASGSGAQPPMANKPNCQTHCGGVSVPYPFGIGPNKECYYDEWFEISCNETTGNIPILRQTQLQVLNISIDSGTLQVNNPVTFFCGENEGRQPPNLTGSPFVYSERHNRFTAVSCGHLARVSSDNDLVGGCRSICEGTVKNYDGCETGINCCQTNIPPYLSSISTALLTENRGRVDDCNAYAFLVDQEWFKKTTSTFNFSAIEDMEDVPVVLQWSYTCNILGGRTKVKLILVGLGAGLGLLLLLIGAWWVRKVLKKRKKIKRKEMFFKRNGGLLLEKQLSSGEVNVEKIKLFKSKELEKSTDNFNGDRILGQGGQGTVYKGMLADGRIVAVKKSKIVDESQLSGFINEVVILSQINHRNVVQLYGCCLETDVPLLVYEFIPNGTLSQYIHEQNEEFPLTWEIRLRIATEIAGALSYLHGAASTPIYHRDIKSSNILLDAKYRAKVADFGTARSVAIDQTHVTTLVHGTFGYLDPEYFQSSQFTEKSDVYSFGVVLVELLTGQKPISLRRSQEEGKSLATYFIISMQEDRLFEILDAQVMTGGSKADIIIVANLARRCLNLSGRKRPTMREVTAELEGVQTTDKNSTGEQNYEEVEYVRTESIEPWDAVSNSARTEPVLDGGSASSFHEIPLISFKSR